MAEHKVVVLPGGANGQPFGRLALLVRLERGDGVLESTISDPGIDAMPLEAIRRARQPPRHTRTPPGSSPQIGSSICQTLKTECCRIMTKHHDC
jgi:hypothetical protein